MGQHSDTNFNPSDRVLVLPVPPPGGKAQGMQGLPDPAGGANPSRSLHGIQEVRGSIPLSSTTLIRRAVSARFLSDVLRYSASLIFSRAFFGK